MKRGNARVIYNGVAYEATVATIPPNSLDIDAPLVCPYSGHRMVVVGESMEPHKWETKHTLRLLCRKCLHLFLYNYVVSHIELSEGKAENA